MFSVYDVTNKILLRDSNYDVDVYETSVILCISMREVMVT